MTEHEFERVEVYDGNKGYDVAFDGRRIASSFTTDQEAYLTAKGALVVVDNFKGTVATYEDWDDLNSDRSVAGDLVERIADALGEKYVEWLDI